MCVYALRSKWPQMSGVSCTLEDFPDCGGVADQVAISDEQGCLRKAKLDVWNPCFNNAAVGQGGFLSFQWMSDTNVGSLF